MMLGQVMYPGRAPRTKETLLDFHEWCRVTQHPLVFRGLTGSQRTPGNGVSQYSLKIPEKTKKKIMSSPSRSILKKYVISIKSN